MEYAALLSSLQTLRAAAAAFDVESISPPACARLVELAAVVEHCVAGLRSAAAARAVVPEGHADRVDWLASVAGESRAAAKSALLIGRLADDECAATRQAVRAGEISIAAADEIVTAEREAPGAEATLLALARQRPLGKVRDEARRLRLAAIDPSRLHEAQQRARRLRFWTNRLGMTCMQGELPPEVGVPLRSRVEAETDRVRAAARRAAKEAAARGEEGSSTEVESREAYAADALVRLLDASSGGAAGAGGGRGRSAELVVVCDINAFRRGHAAEGEACHIVDGGPIPVDVARQLAADAFLKVVLHDGVDILKVKHLGRHFKAELRTALMLGPPPLFDGVECRDGCGRKYGLEIDHVDPVANGGVTSYANSAFRCGPHHAEKTERDRQAGLLGSSGGGRRGGHDPP